VILYDERVSMEILEFARREAKKSCRQQRHLRNRDEINGLIIGLAKAGARRRSGATIPWPTRRTPLPQGRLSRRGVPGITTAATRGRAG
jgi:hypothetical protein